MIEVNNLNVSYGKYNVIKSLNLEIEDSSIICIIGENGSGKTTLLKSILSLIEYDGDILLDKVLLKNMSRSERAKRISYLPQTRPIPSIDVKTLISHGRFPYLGMSNKLSVEDIDIIDKTIDTLNLKKYLNKNLISLSGGERQRVYLAMAMVQDTDIVILDEPTTYMDIKYQIEIMELLKKLNEMGKTIIFTSHDLLQGFTYSHKVMLINNGELEFYESPDKAIMNKSLKEILGVKIKYDDDKHARYPYKIVKDEGI